MNNYNLIFKAKYGISYLALKVLAGISISASTYAIVVMLMCM